MATSNLITNKVQQSLQAFLQTQDFGETLPSTHIYKGIENTVASATEETQQVRILPCVTCVCRQASIEDNEGPNWICGAEVEIRHNAKDTTADQHKELAETVLNTLTTDTVAADLSAALADFTAFLVLPVSQEWDLDGESWVSRFGFNVHCAGSDIS